MIKVIWILVIVQCMLNASGYKILLVVPVPAKSHAILADGIVEHIANAGHEITFISPMLPSKNRSNVNVIHIKETTSLFDAEPPINIKTEMERTDDGNHLVNTIDLLMYINRLTLQNPEVQKLMNDKNQKFDLIILEWMFTEILAGFAAVFNCPFVWFSTLEPHWMVSELFDQISNPAYSVDIMSKNVSPLSFTERVTELGLIVYEKFFQVFYIYNVENDIYETLFMPHIRNRELAVPTFGQLRYNASLLLSNFHVSMSTAMVLPPNIIPIGGFHIGPDVKPMPQDLQELMDNANYGVIYFSMGSNLRSKQFPESIKKELLQVFGELKQTVIWKFEEDLPNRPRNVHILQWAPQQSILAHNNCVLFITHGGLLSTTETIHYGVPIIGIPVFADQFVNVGRAVRKGFAKRVDLSYDIARNLKTAIQDVLSDPKYRNKIKQLSQIYHDRPLLPGKELVHWIEHVVKTEGAAHLRPSRFYVPWYQKMYLDLAVIIIIICVLIRNVLTYIFNLLCKNGTSNSKKFN